MIFAKWKRLFYLCLFVATVPVLAQSTATSMWSTGSTEELKALFPGVSVHSADSDKKRSQNMGYLSAQERNAVFRQLGIEEKIPSFDEFERDMLMMSAGSLPLRQLASEYPMLGESQLSRLKAAVGKR